MSVLCSRYHCERWGSLVSLENSRTRTFWKQNSPIDICRLPRQTLERYLQQQLYPVCQYIHGRLYVCKQQYNFFSFMAPDRIRREYVADWQADAGQDCRTVSRNQILKRDGGENKYYLHCSLFSADDVHGVTTLPRFVQILAKYVYVRPSIRTHNIMSALNSFNSCKSILLKTSVISRPTFFPSLLAG